MRRFFVLMAAVLCLLPLRVSAQERCEPRSSWPYIYGEFVPGVIISSGRAVEAMLNICIASGKLHYIRDGVVMESDMGISSAHTESDEYINAAGTMAQVLLRTEGGCVVRISQVDMDELSKSDIGYGKSAVASTRNLAAYAIEGTSTINRSLGDLVMEKNAGTLLPVRDTVYLFIGGLLVRAARMDIMKMPQVDKDAFKAFVKNEKIRFTSVEDMGKIIEFINSEK